MIRDRVKQSPHAYDGLRRIPARDLLAATAGDEICPPSASFAPTPIAGPAVEETA